MARLRVFTGHIGSGKTEIALNYALQLAQQKDRVCVVDLDIVNPYFCSRDVSEFLQSKGIRLISAAPQLANAELGVISAEVLSVFNDKSYEVVIDVGGDDVGAVALGQYLRYFRLEPYIMYFVVNKHRPLTANKQNVLDYLHRIEAASRLNVTAFVSNTNMSFETTAEDVLTGDHFVSALAEELQLPHAFTVATRDLLKELDGKTRAPLLGIQIFMKPPWM
ncbi:hypothetical protein [Alicyclobacillus mengziensis]|uniref:CobQ/CobB/MinD/ParA nucleotide binding domain-containing protein n=1 Tax=Alicyclobacillus mengziensis TaxID=2931921 RepID=A0A9X7VZY2_9BACL|nr:hypothetical protein [Alicyclobacillus mengziensis]QSO47819.1 hypothetical protein JZ786_01880 [Alicyclobacillus mengziensis]